MNKITKPTTVILTVSIIIVLLVSLGTLNISRAFQASGLNANLTLYASAGDQNSGSDTAQVYVTGGTGPHLTFNWYVNSEYVQTNYGDYASVGDYAYGYFDFAFSFSDLNLGSNTISCEVTDSASNEVTATAGFYLYPPLSVTVSPNPETVDSGQSATFTADVSGGSGSYSYQWTSQSAAPVGGTTSSTLTCTAPTVVQTTQYAVYVKVTDALPACDGLSLCDSSLTPNLTVNPLPTATVSPASANLAVGSTQQFSVLSASGGTGSLSYEWYVNNHDHGTGYDTGDSGPIYYYTAAPDDATFTPSVYVEVTDSLGGIGDSNYASVNVNSASSVSVTVSPDPCTMYVGGTQTFTASATGGTGSYTYDWYLNGADTGQTGSTFDYTAQAGDVNTPPSIYVVAWDTNLNGGTSNTPTITVNPFTAIVSPSAWTMDVGQVQTFTASVYGGTPPFDIEWYVSNSFYGSDVNVQSGGTSFDYIAQSQDTSYPPSIYAIVTDSSTPQLQATSNVATITVSFGPVNQASTGASGTVQGGSVTIDESSTTGVSATISTPTGTPLPDGTQIDVNSASYGSTPPAEVTTPPPISITGGGTAIYYDVSVSQGGGAPLGSNVNVQVSFTDPSITSSSTIAYWDASTSSWIQVTPTVFTAPDTISGSIPASALTGTPIVVGSPQPVFVAPEYSIGALLAVIACFAAFIAIRKPHAPALLNRSKY
ncbi:MAG: hypothetical protein ABSG33_04880 [Candidatus Bathyarchaeia archaeon]